MSRKTVILDRRYVPTGDVIMKEGEQGSIAFLIQSGEVRVYTTSEEREIELARLGTGEIFGEMALISDKPRAASVAATQDCNLIVISRMQFEEKLSDLDPTINAVVRMLTRRIVSANNNLTGKQQSFKDLKENSRQIYQSVFADLTANQKKSMRDMVQPALEEFLGAIEQFQDRYGIDD